LTEEAAGNRKVNQQIPRDGLVKGNDRLYGCQDFRLNGTACWDWVSKCYEMCWQNRAESIPKGAEEGRAEDRGAYEG